MTTKRIPTGIQGLDTILMGGLIANDTHLIYGTPGTGKTILCHQICFNCIKAQNMQCLYLNLHTESPNEIISHLDPFTFYDKDCLPGSLYYIMAQGQIKKHGVRSLIKMISESIQLKQADIFIFEGIGNALYQANSKFEFVDLITQIRSLGQMHTCTIILTNKQPQPDPALTVVDSIIQLSDIILGPRATKQVTIHKTRGSAFMAGRHEVELSSEGLRVYPQIESKIVPLSIVENGNSSRMSTGVGGLDEMMGGGIPVRSSTTIVGMPGVGKTTLGLSFLLEGACRGQEGVYMGFLETPSQLLRKTDSLNMPLRSMTEKGKIHMLWEAPHELILDALAERLINVLKTRNGEGEMRVFIDGIEGFAMAAIYSERIPLFFSAFLAHLRDCRATTLISKNMPLFTPPQLVGQIEFTDQLIDSTIILRYLRNKAHMCRFLSIVKMRESEYHANTRSFRIDKGGMSICDIDEKTEELLHGSSIQF
ncbi:MAG: AAA family ATPase [Chitinivibrionales bacterium]|nr:AAA family ATPase [Chitinivibrionales bacterium]